MKDGFGRDLIDDAEFGGPLVSAKHLWLGKLISFAYGAQTSTASQLKRRAHDVLMEVPQEVKDEWPGVFEHLCTCGHLDGSHVGLDKLCRLCGLCAGFSASASYPSSPIQEEEKV